MPRQSSVAKKAMNASIPVDLHRALKAHAASTGQTIEAVVTAALLRYLPKRVMVRVRPAKEA